MNRQTVIYRLRSSPFIRRTLAPLIRLQREKERKEFVKTPDADFLRSLKNTRTGERCFVIGNGPSLTTEDLDRLQGECCFASNRIYYLFDRTLWRPDYYFCVDGDVLVREIGEIKKAEMPCKFLRTIAQKYGRKPEDHIRYIIQYGPFFENRAQIWQQGFSEQVDRYFSISTTVTTCAIELAVYMGFQKIYLLGVDHQFSRTINSAGKVKKHLGVTDYFSGMKHGNDITIGNVDSMTHSYEICRDYAKNHGIEIYNATRGGKLEVFPRVNLDEVLGT